MKRRSVTKLLHCNMLTNFSRQPFANKASASKTTRPETQRESCAAQLWPVEEMGRVGAGDD